MSQCHRKHVILSKLQEIYFIFTAQCRYLIRTYFSKWKNLDLKWKWPNACGWEVSLYQYLTNRQSTNIGELDIVSCCTNTLNLCSDSDFLGKNTIKSHVTFYCRGPGSSSYLSVSLCLSLSTLNRCLGKTQILGVLQSYKLKVELLKCKPFCGKLLNGFHTSVTNSQNLAYCPL